MRAAVCRTARNAAPTRSAGTLGTVTHEIYAPRTATREDAAVVAALLDRFNREFETPTPGPGVLTARLKHLLLTGDVLAVLAGRPPVGVAVLSMRPNVWYDGPVALLDELYVIPERRGQGIGAALLRAAESLCVRRGGKLLEINVDGEDTDARRFYERHGYSNRDPGQIQPQLYYSRELTAPPPGTSPRS
jgi:GNAT superfamily N-acetyltransferase